MVEKWEYWGRWMLIDGFRYLNERGRLGVKTIAAECVFLEGLYDGQLE